jgi:hypothetical protein
MATLRKALHAYFVDNGLDEDGGYDKALDWFPIGPLALPIPNVAERRAALPYHDASHVLTGYQADWRGEFEESAYEVASGCGGNWFGLIVNHQGMIAGLLLTPARTVAAWRRGAASGTAYGLDLDGLLDLEVEEVRRRVGVADRMVPWNGSTVLHFVTDVLKAIVIGGGPLLAVGGGLWMLVSALLA